VLPTGVGLGRAAIGFEDVTVDVTSVFLLFVEHPSSANANIIATTVDSTVVTEMPTPNVRRNPLATLFLFSELRDLEFAI
jgi:hypothetical protein